VIRLWLAIPVAAVLAVSVGCGGSEDPPPSPGPAVDAEIRASGDEDSQIGAGMKQYIVRNCPPPGTKPAIPKKYRGTPYYPGLKQTFVATVALCESIATIEVEDSRMTVRTDLKDDARGRAAAERFCELVQAADVADFTPGHELQDFEGETIKVCPARTS
jgi:hypothetical protein